MIKLMQAFPCGAERSRSRALQYADSTFSSLEHADIRNSLNNYKIKYMRIGLSALKPRMTREFPLCEQENFSQPW